VLEFIQGGLDFQSTNGMGDLEGGRGANGTRSTTGGGARPADDHRMALTIGRVIDYIEVSFPFPHAGYIRRHLKLYGVQRLVRKLSEQSRMLKEKMMS
jgi:hypothetical protein